VVSDHEDDEARHAAASAVFTRVARAATVDRTRARTTPNTVSINPSHAGSSTHGGREIVNDRTPDDQAVTTAMLARDLFPFLLTLQTLTPQPGLRREPQRRCRGFASTARRRNIRLNFCRAGLGDSPSARWGPERPNTRPCCSYLRRVFVVSVEDHRQESA
jgi:hypothetical protein